MEGSAHQPQIIFIHGRHELLLGFEQRLHAESLGLPLKPQLDSRVVLVEFYIIAFGLSILLDLLEHMLTVQPHQLDWTQLDNHLF